MSNKRIPLLGSLPPIVPKYLFKTGAGFVAVGIIAGGFGAHGLKKRSGIDADKIHSWETAAHYTIVNGLALMLLSLHPRFSAHRFAGPAIVVGGIMFSLSMAALVLNRERFRVLGPVASMGGAVMIAG